MRRVVVPELLDSDQGTRDEIQSSLADLRAINRRWGGVDTTVRLLRRVAEATGSKELSVLDVAAGSGDVMAATKERLAAEGVRLRYTLLDSARSHLNGFRPSVVANALELPFRDASFDVVSCSLFLHHLEPEDISKFVKQSMRVCRHALTINDLRRSALHLALVYAGFPTFSSRLTRHDGPASVRRAYTTEEVRRMLAHTTAGEIEIQRQYLYRMGVIAWKARRSG